MRGSRVLLNDGNTHKEGIYKKDYLGELNDEKKYD